MIHKDKRGCTAHAKVSGGIWTLACIKGVIFSQFSGKASAAAQDTHDGRRRLFKNAEK